MLQFRTKARAVDLLGKGQIADLPTAITELWKNGYDAYADVLTAEIFLKGYKGLGKPIFAITDDGKGMSKKDIFEKWLVLGTDSKSRSDITEEKSIETLWKKPRVKAGEKGIGRLSVAFLGSPMLVLTKKRGHPLQAIYFDWRLLENYNLFLEDVQIPVLELTEASEFKSIFNELQKNFLSNFDKKKDAEGNSVWEKSQENLRDKIITSTEELELPDFFEDDIISQLINIKEHNGSRFFIFEPEPQILDLLNNNAEDSNNEFVRSSLAGFTNQFKENPLPIKTKFPIHKTQGYDYDFLTGSGSFFEPNDYNQADILIEGKFDGEGNFTGTLKIYDDAPFDYKFSSTRKKDIRSYYGPFSIKLGYSMGAESSSKLSDAAYKKIKEKVTDFGALYIYRDGFRVLPYGRPDVDFLEFEEKRSRRASTYFFSHRRMFGYIEISRKENESLKDKAGREGFINNAAYRGFKTDLQGLFDELAAEYFGDKARNKSVFLDKKEDVQKNSETLKKDKEREKQEKSAFTRSLKQYPKQFAEYKKKYTDLLSQLETNLANPDVVYSDIEELLGGITKLDVEYKNLLPSLPTRYKPTDTQLDRLSAYEVELVDFNNEIKEKSKVLLKQTKRLLQIQELKQEFEKNYQLYKSELESLIYSNKEQLRSKSNSLGREFDERSNTILSELDYQKNNAVDNIKSKEDVIAELDNIKEKFEFLREQLEKEIFPLVVHISRLDFDIDEELVQGIYKDEYDKIKYQWEQTRETAQLGVAVEIIDHEFNVLYSQINSSLKKMEGELESPTDTFMHLKSFFSQLEDKYQLLSPLYRIAGVVPKEIDGESIFVYLNKFFNKRLAEEEIEFTLTNSFKRHKITIKEPVIHTVFINLINNAIYWVRNSEVKKIVLDYLPETDEILIMNSGTSIKEHRLEKIFELFYSNRPNGRGIGLYLAKQSLEENYFNIYATNDKHYNKLNGACFVIKPLNT